MRYQPTHRSATNPPANRATIPVRTAMASEDSQESIGKGRVGNREPGTATGSTPARAAPNGRATGSGHFVRFRTLSNEAGEPFVSAAMTSWRFSLLMLALVASPAVAQPATPFDYDSRAPLRLESTLLRRDQDVDVHAISFDSPRGGRVTGKLFVPATPRPTRFAGVVMAHGAPGSTANMDPRALFVARKGAVVIGIDAAFARRDPNDPVTFTTRDADEQ